MKRAMALVLLMASPVLAAPKDAAKKALQELGDFVGGWKGAGGHKLSPGPRDKSWDETVQWGWKFKGDDCWMVVEFKGGKFLKSAELRYDVAKKKYVLTGTLPDGKTKSVFTGKFDDDKLTFEGDDEDKGKLRLRINTAAEGIRLVYIVESKKGTIWKPEFALAATKEGESLTKKEKGPECVVSGGRGTSTVSYMGETFYICCSGCADAFKENPKKYVDEFKAKKK
ncbi:MAG: YHS domain-containing protein [Gemmataceae bacterium]|nr:YHS domain-containing protein [Gemmataceae bacterium]